MEVDGPDYALESATHGQLRARESGKIAAFIANLWPNAPVSELIGKLSHDNAPLDVTRISIRRIIPRAV